MRWDVRYKRKQAPEPDGGGACVWILNLSLWSSVNALYQIFMRGHTKKSRKAQRKSRQRIGARSTPFRSPPRATPSQIQEISKATQSKINALSHVFPQRIE